MNVINWTQVIGQVVILLGNGVVIGWVWKVMNKQYDNLNHEFTRYKDDTGKRIDKLELDLIHSNQTATQWFRRFYKLTTIIQFNHCKDRDCEIMRAYNKLQEEEGEVK